MSHSFYLKYSDEDPLFRLSHTLALLFVWYLAVMAALTYGPVRLSSIPMAHGILYQLSSTLYMAASPYLPIRPFTSFHLYAHSFHSEVALYNGILGI